MSSRDEDKIDRRALMGVTALAAATIPLCARAADEIETIPLWPSVPPGGEGLHFPAEPFTRDEPPGTEDRALSDIGRPTLSVFRPASPDGSAILIMPGGGFSYEAIDWEGEAPAKLFVESGITGYVLTYRLPSEGWKDGPNVPLQDAQRAIRIIRGLGTRSHGIDPARVGVLGFSAGGYVAGSLATKFESKTYDAVDEMDRYDTKPSFAALLYPVITMLAPYAHEASCEKLLGANASAALRAAYSVERAVTQETPPCFLTVAADDPDVPIDNSFIMFGTLRAAKVASELHVFEQGGHGFGIGIPRKPASDWPQLFLNWGASHMFFRKVA